MNSEKISGEKFLSWRRIQLSKGGRKVDFDWLLDYGAGLTWSNLQKIIIDQNKTVVLERSLCELTSLWQKHIEGGVPLQHLLGFSPWRDFQLEVNSSVLIPRQETELIIDFALEKFTCNSYGIWADLGTGSGAIAIALSKSFPNWIGHAVDRSENALDVAKKNAERLIPKAKVTFHCGNWCDPLKPWWGSFDVVLSNPPYIPSSLIAKLEPSVRNHEPYEALCGGDDGLMSCRAVVNGASEALKKDGWLIFEHHHDQSDQALNLLIQKGFINVESRTDLSGVFRFALGQKTN